MRLINLTPHTVNVCDESGSVVRSIEPSGKVLRLPTRAYAAGELDEIPLVRLSYEEPEDLPPAEDGTVYIVSSLMLEPLAAIGRRDFVAPDTSPGSVVRDESGRIIGVKRFIVA